jgi:hypothetical protein
MIKIIIFMQKRIQEVKFKNQINWVMQKKSNKTIFLEACLHKK